MRLVVAALRDYLALSRRRDRPADVTIDALVAAAHADRVGTVRATRDIAGSRAGA